MPLSHILSALFGLVVTISFSPAQEYSLKPLTSSIPSASPGEKSILQPLVLSPTIKSEGRKDDSANQNRSMAPLGTDPVKADQSVQSSTSNQLQSEFELLKKNQTVFTADNQFKVVIFGSLVGETISSSQRITSAGSYLFVNPFLGRDSPSIEVQGRGTSLGAVITGPEICGFQSGGQVLVYLYGQSPFANLYGLFFAFAYADLKNDDWRFTFGLAQDSFNPLNPTTLNFGYGLDAGNTGFIRGQFRVERFLKITDDFQITLQSGIGQPVITEFAAPFPGSDITLGETTGWPNLDARLVLGFGKSISRYGSPLPSRKYEVGVSGLIGRIRTSSEATRVTSTTAGLGVDLTANITDKFGVKCECYKGQAMGSYFGGSGQSVNTDNFQAIRSIGGWTEVFYYLSPKVHTHWGGGIDDPRNQDVGNNQRKQNQFVFGT